LLTFAISLGSLLLSIQQHNLYAMNDPPSAGDAIVRYAETSSLILPKTRIFPQLAYNLPAGSLEIHHPLIPHCSPPNTSHDRSRRVIIMRYQLASEPQSGLMSIIQAKHLAQQICVTPGGFVQHWQHDIEFVKYDYVVAGVVKGKQREHIVSYTYQSQSSRRGIEIAQNHITNRGGPLHNQTKVPKIHS
jgi:hypothetical protein